MNKKYIAFGVMGLFVMALATAGLVGYLSNEIEASVTVDLPVLLEISADGTSDSWLGADSDGVTSLVLDNTYPLVPVTFWVRDTNLASVDMPGQSLKTVTNTDGITCEHFASVTANGIDLLELANGCVQVEGNLNSVDFSEYTSKGLAAKGEAGDSATNEIVMTFAPGAEGTYVFEMQKKTLDYFA